MSMCTFQGCERVSHARGYCTGHYQQAMKGLDLKPLIKRSLNPSERFWQKVDKGGNSDCWLWRGASDESGYGSMWKSGRPRKAHRVAFELANGPIPAGMVIDHKCRVPSCVNPAHLQSVTLRENNENLATERPTRSGIRGVCWNKDHGKWAAYVSSRGVRYNLGFFSEVMDAKRVVVAKRLELHTNNLLDRRAA